MSQSDLSDFLPFLLFQAAETTSRGFQQRYRSRYGMLRTEWRVLFHLGQTGPQTAKQICERAALHKTKVSRAVRALEQKRYLSRDAHPSDRRSEILALTRLGQTVMRDLSNEADTFDSNLEAKLGASTYAELVTTLKRVIET